MNKETTKTKFRLQSKNLFLTYPKIESNLTKEFILKQLQGRFITNKINNYIIALEDHKDKTKHMHVLLMLNKRCDIKRQNYLDLNLNENVYHGNYQSVRNIEKVIKYVTKDNNYISNMDLQDGKVLPLREKLLHLLELKGLSFTLEYLRNHHKDVCATKYALIKNNLKTYYNDFQASKLIKANYSIDMYEEHKELNSLIDLSVKSHI